MHEPREHEAFCTIDPMGFVTTHDTLEEAERAAVVDPDVGATHLYIGRFIPFRPKRLTLRQARWLWVSGVLAGSVLLDVAENYVRWMIWGLPVIR